MNSIQTLLTDHLDIWTVADTEKKSGRGRSSGNAASVYGIRKLRELILELAVCGKLVPQDTSDEQASVLLKRIQTEKTKLIAEGKIKKDKPLAVITENEKPFELPQGWEWTRVAHVGHDWGQKTPDSDFTYIEVSAIDSQRGIVSSPELVKPENAPSRARKVVKKGTVIYSTIRPYLLNVAVIEDDFSPEPIASTAFAIVHPFCLMPPRYFLCFFRSPVFVRHVESVQMGIAYPAINDGQFFSSLIPLPPLAEQHRIVAKVDELMAMCDQLEQQQTHGIAAHQTLVETLLGTLTRVASQQEFSAAWARIASHFDTLLTTEQSIDQLKQTILQLAVMGKLVPQNPNESSAIKAGVLGDFLNFLNGYAFKSEWFMPNGIRLLRNMNVGHRVCDWSNSVHIDESRFTEFEKFSLAEGDLVLSLDRPLISSGLKVARIRQHDLPCLLLQRVAKFEVDPTVIDLDYLEVWLRSSEFMDKIDPGRSNGVPHISTKQVAAIPFVRYPVSLQKRIVAKVDELMALCDTLKARLAVAQTIQLHLADAIVEQAVC